MMKLTPNGLCAVCNSAKARRTLYRAQVGCIPFEVHECVRCKLSWVDPIVTNATPDNECAQSYEIEVYKTQAGRQRKRFARQLSLVETLVRPGTPRTLLDIGCGCGHLVDVAMSRGYDAAGIDSSLHAVRQAKSLYPHATILQGVAEVMTVSNTFDVVAALNVIEHTESPLEFVKAIRRYLSNGGVLLLETPTSTGLWHRLNSVAFTISGQPLFSTVDPKGHRYLFSPRSLNVLLSKQGFSVLDIRYLMSPYFELLGKLRAQRTSLAFQFAYTALWIMSYSLHLPNRIQVVARKEF